MVTHRAVEDDAESGGDRVTPLRFLHQVGKPRIKGSSGGRRVVRYHCVSFASIKAEGHSESVHTDVTQST
jgi:hypothetical protein